MKKIPAPTTNNLETGWFNNFIFLQDMKDGLWSTWSLTTIDEEELDYIIEYLIKEGYLERA